MGTGGRCMLKTTSCLRSIRRMHSAGASPHWEELRGQQGGLPKGSRFDVAGSSLTLMAELSRSVHATRPGMTAFVPGCGRAYDAIALAAHGFESVVAMDLSPSACEAAREELRSSSSPAADRVEIRCGDFFAHNELSSFDLIWDCTFLCALDPSVREQWADRMSALLAPGGELLTCVFPIGEREGGPPYSMTVDLVTNLLQPVGFEAVEVLDQLPMEEQHRRPGDELESVLGRGTALVTWRQQSTL